MMMTLFYVSGLTESGIELCEVGSGGNGWRANVKLTVPQDILSRLVGRQVWVSDGIIGERSIAAWVPLPDKTSAPERNII